MNWKEELDIIISKRQLTLHQVSDFLKILKKDRVRQSDVEAYLYDKRENGLPEEVEDWMLEILDIVTGYCQEQYRVW